MDMPEVKSFNAELSGLYDNKPPISKAKMSAITKGAIKAIKFYKHVVHSVEKFIQKCKPEYKVPGLYVIDSIVRQSRHQFGQDKDVFAPRFAKNMQQTFANLFRCPPEDKRNIIRVLNLWQKNNVFSPQVIQPLLDMADPNHPLHQEIQQQQNNTANGSTLNVSHSSDNKMSPQHSPHASSPMGGDQFQDEPDPQSKFNRKLLNDFEYDSEDDMPMDTGGGGGGGGGHGNQSSHSSHMPHANQQNPTDALGSILTNPEIMRQLQSLQAQMSMMTGMQIPNLMPMMSDLQMQQNQNQGLPFMNAQQDGQKQSEAKDDMGNNESDIEFVETGPQVIEIPDANDSSPSPKSRRHRSRSKSPRRRRRSRSRSRSPRRRRDRDRDRDRERDRDKERDKEKNYKEREADREKQREREKKGLPPIKKENLSVCSTTLWVGHLSKLATPEELSDLFGGVGGVAAIDVVAPRGCAFVVMERRRDAAKALAKLNRHKLHSKEITVAWAPGKGVKGREWKDHWEAELGVSYLPWQQLQQRWALGALSLDALEDGGAVDEDTLPPWLPPRILPKSMMENMSMMTGMPPPSILPNLSNMPGNLPPGNLPLPPASLAGALPPVSLAPNLTTLAGPNLSLPPNMAAPLAVTRMPPPGMAPGMPPGLAPGMPPGIRPPSIPAGVPGLQPDAGLPPPGPLLRFPPGMPPQTMPQPGMVGGFLGGLLGVGVGGLVGGVPLLHHAPMHHATPPQPVQQQRPGEVNQCDDAMDLDTEEHADERNNDDAPALLPDQIQALLSKPPPNFNASEPPPGFNLSEPPPFNVNQPPPSADDKQDDERKDRDRERRDRDRDRRERDRGGERRDRDRRDRERGRGERGEREERRDNREGRDNRERDNRDNRENRERPDNRENRENRDGRDTRDRDRDRGRGDRRDRDRERGERGERQDRFANRPNDNNGERSREKSPRSGPPSEAPEKSLQERLWEMANGKPARDDKREEFEGEPRDERPPLIDRVPPRHDGPPPGMDAVAEGSPGADNWTSLAPPRPPPLLAPPFRAELRMRGPPRPPNMQGPWMDGPGPGPFGPRFNGMGPPFNRPPFDGPRPPFDGAPLFEGGPRFERPPFARMPFDAINRPPFDGPRPPFDGPRPPFDGPRPPFDGPRPPFDGPRPPFDGPRPFDGPPFDGDRPPFDGPPRFDGPPEFFDRGRRFDDREPFQDRWGGGDRDRGDREWGDRERRPEWDDRRRDRRDRPGPGPGPGPREHDDRFNRDRNNDRRRPYDDNRPRRQSENRQPDTPTKSDAAKQDAPQIDAPKQADAPKQMDVPKADPPKDEERKRRDRDRKSRWGAAEEPSETTESAEAIAASNEIPPEFMDILERDTGKDNSAGAEVSERMEESRDTHEQGSAPVPFNDSAGDETNESRESAKDEQNEERTEAPASHNVPDDADDSYTEEKEYESESPAPPAKDTYDEEKLFEREFDAPAVVDTYSEEKQYDRQDDDEQSYSAPVETEEPAPIEAAREAPMTDLYDASDAVDTSFSMAAPEPCDAPAPPPVEAVHQSMDEAPKAVDMFSPEREQREEGESSDARSNSSESKEGA